MAVTTEWRGGFQCDARVLESGHVVHGDEPEAVGGDNTGANPFGLLQASLANCTVVTVVGEAQLLGVELAGLTVSVRHKQNMLPVGPADPKQRDLRITQFRRDITVRGDLSEDQRDRLLWAAEHCPVSNSLAGTIDIVTTLHHDS